MDDRAVAGASAASTASGLEQRSSASPAARRASPGLGRAARRRSRPAPFASPAPRRRLLLAVPAAAGAAARALLRRRRGVAVLGRLGLAGLGASSSTSAARRRPRSRRRLGRSLGRRPRPSRRRRRRRPRPRRFLRVGRACARVGFSASASAVSGSRVCLDRREQLGPGDALGDGGDAHLDLLADELRGVADDDVDVLDLADAGVRVVQADLAELQLELLRRRRPAAVGATFSSVPWSSTGSDRGARRPCRRGRSGAWSSPRARAAACRRGRRRARRPSRSTSTLKAFDARARRDERAQPALDVDGGRVLGDDDPVAAAGRALLRHHLARAVGDVLARHLDEAERRDLDDVGLRAVALELLAERLLDLLRGSSGSPCR